MGNSSRLSVEECAFNLPDKPEALASGSFT